MACVYFANHKALNFVNIHKYIRYKTLIILKIKVYLHSKCENKPKIIKTSNSKCMKNRLSKLSRKAYFMLLLLAVSGISTSCKDEYTLDDEKPGWLGSSIYESLKAEGTYTNYLRLLADPDVNLTNARPLTEVLSRTGSKTVFVADDDAWEEFFKQNALLPESDPWHNATSYENLSVSQKKLLIHTSMLNNAIVMENLASSEGRNVARGEYMRRYTDIETTDSITHLDGNSLPVNYNVNNKEKDYWSRFRTENGGNGLYLVSDSSLSMMLHFTGEHLTKNNITDADFEKFMGRSRITSDVHIYDALLLEKDGVTENGYVNKTEKVLKPLANMAEVIRTNGETNIFSHMLDRWSAPFYNSHVTERYKDVMASRGITWTDSIFTKRYFSNLSFQHRPLVSDPDGQIFRDSSSTEVGLKFDPGWNGYYDEQPGPQYDMASMFVPNDETMWKYFTQGGGGWQLIQTYCDPTVEYSDAHTAEDYEKLFRNIDQIPISTLRSLINVIMFRSFISSVPSKMTKLRDDAQEQIFYTEDVDHIKKSLLANNGVIYIMDKVYGPADYTAVTAPAYISKDNLVLRWAIYNGSEQGKTDYMGLNYYAYLKAMQSRFVLFLPSDKAMYYYYDPVSFTSQKSRLLHLYYKSGSFPISYNMYNYNAQTGEIGQLYKAEKMTNPEITNRLKDILESHTIVLDGLDEINSDEDEYYLAKNGAAVKVTRENGHVVKVQGGFQLENEESGITGSIGATNYEAYTEIKGINENLVTDEQTMSNGTTYILDSPIIPASRSVFNIFTNNQQYDSEYSEFYKLTEVDEEIVRACGLVDETNLTLSQQKSELKKYQIFIDDKGPDYNIQFFNNYRYTIFVPTNDAILDAISNGLPTWEEIKADYDECKKDTIDEHLLLAEDSIRLQTKITYLVNFVRYHFADNSVFVDKSQFSPTDYVTASYDNEKGLFCKLYVQRVAGSGGTELQVQDANSHENGGGWITVGGKYNVMARDVSCSTTPTGKVSMNNITIDGSSFAVIHQIPAVLNHTALVNGRYDSQWAKPSEAKRYTKKFNRPRKMPAHTDMFTNLLKPTSHE